MSIRSLTTILYAAAVLTGCSATGGAGSGATVTVTVHTIDYLVIGDSGATAMHITYNTGGGGQQQETAVPLPWSTKFTTGEAPALVVLAQNAGGGSIACAILVDGQNISQQVSKGQYAAVTCSGTIPPGEPGHIDS
jgi:Mycobacterium membrane protein